MDSSGSPGTATFGNDSSSGSTGMLAVPAIAGPPNTQQSASAGISHDLSHSSWREVGPTVWSKDGEEKIVISFIIDMCERGKRAIQIAYRL